MMMDSAMMLTSSIRQGHSPFVSYSSLLIRQQIKLVDDRIAQQQQQLH